MQQDENVATESTGQTDSPAGADGESKAGTRRTETLESVVVRFCGDSGDGMQFTGTQFTNTAAIFGNDIATLPDYPAEIRAPAGTLPGVSGFQVNLAADDIFTPGDRVNVLVAMNPAGLKANLSDLEPGGVLIINEDAFNAGNLRKAGYETNPAEDGSLAKYQVYPIPISRLTEESLADTGMGAKAIAQAKNMYTLGIVFWLFDRSLEPTIDKLNLIFGKQKKKPEVAELNIKALKAGYYMGETGEMFPVRYKVPRARLAPGRYRAVSGNEALAMGLAAATRLARKSLTYASYPITPASDILHQLSTLKHFDIKTMQMEDEIAAVCAAIGAAFAGDIGVTGTSGPGLALKSEAINLAVMAELPLLVINVQRGGPSTGLPTKPEQSDLLQAMFGRNGESPVVVIAPRGPGDCFHMAIQAVRIATTFMVPVILLSDGYIANGAEPWLIPDVDSLEPINIRHATEFNFHEADVDGEGNNAYMPYLRDENLVRPWAIPGTPKLEHRLGGLEKADISGNVSYEPENHQHMTNIRAQKVKNVAKILPPTEIDGDDSGDVLLVGWGGTYGAIHSTVRTLRRTGRKVSAVHLNYINPMPNDLGEILGRFRNVLVPELNSGQLRMLLRDRYLVDAIGINKVQGKPFLVAELAARVEEILSR